MKDLIIEYIVTAVLALVVAAIIAKIKLITVEIKATKAGLQSLLRLEIIHSYNRCHEKGYCPIYTREAIEKAYDSYHSLGGNGTITHLYEEMQNMPTEKPKSK